MINEFEKELKRRLATIREQGLYRELRRVDSPQSTRIVIAGCELLNFSSNDYLGLASHPALREAAARAAGNVGAGSGASRLICGSLATHQELEEVLAAFKGTEAALSFSSGYTTALGVIGALLDRQDILIIDKLVHACVVDAARLSGAKLRVFAHNDMNDLEAKLKWARDKIPIASGAAREPRVLIVTESVFSMDGDLAPLEQLLKLKEKHGAWLMLDEAHATGLYGEKRRGLAEAVGVADRVEVQMGTLGKAVGAAGGYVCGSRNLIDYLINRARSFIFSTAPVPAAAAAARAGIELIQSDEGRLRVNRLWENVARVGKELNAIGMKRPQTRAAIVPIRIGDESRAVETAGRLREFGVFIPAIRFPTVARGAARLRLTLTSAHTDRDLNQLVEALATSLPGNTDS